MSAAIWLAVSGALVVGALGIYLGYLLRQIGAQRRAGAEVAKILAAENQRMHDDRVRSIELLCMAALDGDCDLSEACIRIHKLLSYYPRLSAEGAGQTIAAMYEEIQDFDTHEARRALPSAARRKQDRARRAIEDRHRDALLRSFGELLPRIRSLHGTAYDCEWAIGVRSA
jgi:hypothetical protein